MFRTKLLQYMELIENTTFPPISTGIDLETFLQNELVFFYFQCTRFSGKKSSDEELFTIRYNQVLSTLKNNIDSSYLFIDTFFNLFYNLVIQTRSIHHGKGEHHLSYIMIFSWYSYFPNFAVKLIRNILSKDIYSSHGSWRDIKYLCQYCKEHSTLETKHPLILTCIEITNKQLKQDLYNWNFSLHPRDRNYISSVAKWIPREKKKHNWLFEMFVIHWINMKNPHILSTPTNYSSYHKAICKATRIYRKNVSFLNKIIETTEINQCSQTIDTISPYTASSIAVSKQPNTFFGTQDQKHLHCKSKFEHAISCKITNIHSSTGYPRIFTPLPMYYYVKEAISLSKNTDTTHQSKIQVLNDQWKLLSLSFSSQSFQYTIPIIDTNSNNESLYSSIAFSIMIAQHNKIQNRVFLVGQHHQWISFDHLDNFVDIVSYIYKHIDPVLDMLSIDSLFKHIGQTFLKSSSNLTTNNLRFVLFSTFSHSFYTNLLDTYLHEHISNIVEKFLFRQPSIIYWNVSTQFNEFLPCKHDDYNTMLLSGFSPQLLTILKSIPKHNIQNPYETISYILTHPSLQNIPIL